MVGVVAAGRLAHLLLGQRQCGKIDVLGSRYEAESVGLDQQCVRRRCKLQSLARPSCPVADAQRQVAHLDSWGKSVSQWVLLFACHGCM